MVKDEVIKALVKTRELYERWRIGDEGIELRSAEEQEWAATELRSKYFLIQSITSILNLRVKFLTSIYLCLNICRFPEINRMGSRRFG